MKWFFVSDLHASLNLPHAKINADGTSSDRLQDVIDVIDDLTFCAKKEKPSAVFILGDMFHSRHPDAPTLKAVSRALRDLADVVQVYILPGNHDAHSKNSDVYSLSMFNELRVPGVMVFDQPEIFTEGEVDFLIMPWVPDDQFVSRLDGFLENALFDSKKRVLLMHQSISGASSNGRKMTGIAPSEFAKHFDLVLSGHIHEPQCIGPKVRYLGSPLQLSFSEADGIPRGWYVMNSDLDIEQRPVESSPEFIKWTFGANGEDLVPHYEDLIDDLVRDLKESTLTREVYLQVHVFGSRAKVDHVVRELEVELGMALPEARMISIKRIITDDGSDRVRNVSNSKGSSLTPSELVKLYVEVNASVLPDGVNIEDVLEVGQKLLGETL